MMPAFAISQGYRQNQIMSKSALNIETHYASETEIKVLNKMLKKNYSQKKLRARRSINVLLLLNIFQKQ